MVPGPSPASSPSLTQAPLGSWCVSVLGGLGGLIVCGGAQIPVPPAALTLLFLLILQSPLPGQAGGGGREEGKKVSAAQTPGSPDTCSQTRSLQGLGEQIPSRSGMSAGGYGTLETWLG